jgi:predicted Ser/Thr protein kinase
VDPERIRINQQLPPVTIEEVSIDKAHYSPVETPLVAPGRGEIEIQYAGLSFLEPEKVRFKYRLEGFDQGWVAAGSRRVAYYTNIPPGAYRFRVAAANNDGVWNEEGASFSFELKPHFYQATWFWAIGGLGTVFVALAAHRVRIRRLALRERQLAALVADRTRELQEANGKLAFLAEVREKEEMVALVREMIASSATAAAATTRTRSLADLSEISKATSSVVLPNTLGEAPSPASQFVRGSVLAGRYVLEEVVGKGGMGIVYRAYDRELEEWVAVKFLVPDAEGRNSVERLKQEIKIARRVSHRNIVRTHDFGEAADTPFVSMEYVEGTTLKNVLLWAGALPLGAGLRISKQLCQGVDAAHRQGIVHRDLKPGNVLILPDSGELKIMDFGIARISQVQVQGTTLAGTILGTPAYMSPEQALGKPADFRSDMYSLGILFFEVFIGQLPFHAESTIELLQRHIATAPPHPRSLKPQLPEALETVILRCLQKDPQLRYSAVSEILADLTMLSTALSPEPPKAA